MKKIALLFFACILVNLSSTIINIPDDQLTIQAGIIVAENGDTILVHSGTYIENINYNGKNVTVGSLFLTTQDTTYISQTVIDGNENGSVVMFNNGETSAKLCGFTLTNGSGYGSSSKGGGIYCFDSSPVLENLRIINNTLVGQNNSFGGGVYCEASSPEMRNIEIRYNTATTVNQYGGYGGGIHCCENSDPIIENVIISNNSADCVGGVYCHDSSPTFSFVDVSDNVGSGLMLGYNCTSSLTDVTVSNNSGIGVSCGLNSSPSFVNVLITENVTTETGGGINCSYSNPILTNVIISNNHANISGGGIYFHNSNPILTNVIIYDNSVNVMGGGIYCSNSSPILTNVTITENLAASWGGAFYCGYNSNPVLVNSILYDNSPEEIFFHGPGSPNSISISYSNIEGGESEIFTCNNATIYWLEGNIDEDPLFVGSGENPTFIQESSPCIDSGIPDTTGLYLPPWDIVGNHRIWDGDENGEARIDMGAYEYGSPIYTEVNNPLIPHPNNNNHNLLNFPNPFNPTTCISFSLHSKGHIDLKVYNLKGQLVKTLINDYYEKGHHSIFWDGKDGNRQEVASGIYYSILKTNSGKQVSKMVLLK